MSTRANVIIKDEFTTLYFYRHSDGYPKETGKDLKLFVSNYTAGRFRADAMQSAGWLIVHGHNDPDYQGKLGPYAWKVGAYEPCDRLMNDVEYIYIIDLCDGTLSCIEPDSSYWNEPAIYNTNRCEEFQTVSFI